MALKTYGVNYNGWTRRIVAAKSRAEAARLIGITPYRMSTYGCETRNTKEVELAMREPGVVWGQGYNLSAKWIRVPNLV